MVRGLTAPVLNELHVPQVLKHRKATQNPDLSNEKPVFEKTFKPGKGWKKVKFSKKRARYFCIEALSSQKGDPFTTIAELYLLDKNGNRLPRKKWKVVYADSEELGGDDGNANNVFDLQPTTFWHTEWMDNAPGHPHILIVDIGEIQAISGLEYLPRQDSPNGRLKDIRFYLSKTPFKGL